MITSRTPRRTGSPLVGASLTVGLAVLALTGTGAQAQTWTKTGSPGNLPATAQVTQGVGVLTTILGSLGTISTASTASNPDLFQIYINGASPFSATTVGPATTLFDTQLFLFDSAGAAVYANDDASTFTKGALLNPVAPLASGFYFLGVSAYGAIPRSGGTTSAFDMFPNTVDDTSGTVPFTGLKGPKAGVTGPLTNWSLSSADVETGVYSIALSGASYAAPVPESSTTVSLGLLLLLGLGGVVIAAKRKKTKVETASIA